ncbi:MAG: winged helix-turn-helix domain-containing protein [Elusimicrobia bacterium]|nr:winged helix-turn-helix domain-containing protein [Elusimicrobiota bacterium]
MGNTILIAEDDREVLRILDRYFSVCGFTVYSAENNAAAIELAGRYRPDCFLLDYHLADGPAAGICRFVRGDEYLKKAPIIMLSGDPGQIINSCEICQADVFVQKGRGCAELLAVVKRQLNRVEWDRGVIKKPDFTLNAATLCIMRGERPTHQLSPEQFRFFSLLVEKSPDFVTEEAICSYVFMDTPSERQEAISSLVYRLRRKLGPRLARRIKNKRYRGWIYVQPRLQTRKPSADSNRPEKPCRPALKT